MESNIKGLVSAGHEMASELKAECGAVDMRSVAKLISDLATQLEVQLVRANALAEDHQRAIESIKQADSAVKLAHEKFSALAAENAALKAAHPQPFGPEMMKALDAYEKYQDEVPETGMLNAFFILRDSIRVDTPATDAFLTEIERKAIRKFINNIEHILRDKLSPYDTEEMLEAMRIFLEEQGGEQK
ncbi:hypothetical protein HmCmsJML158_04202 [Escherichia coli]|uniref:hypothetical protein n=1 Tax=Escherichia coli TaxID=562 RepID=UPI000DDE8C36|nr:hypothetical protein [Escherichia coli]MDM7232059.1 hypothetical protein [Escherichia coli]WJW00572.1 hypothetical protein QVN05_06765 [Escherichia coli]GCS66929.1 hypothetical protein HmCmsJML015_04513 [Escherichia coli]GCT77024.1 hypothetical protein HmCms151_04861 [Escherichia coli]GCU00711.1 hypothetical protein HmCms177_04187 [Escherichia coli]